VEQFFIVATLHGFSMVLPASNHVMILRIAMGAGWHAAAAASFGAALGTAVICAITFMAVGAMANGGMWMLVMQCIGCLMLLRLAGMCLRDAGMTTFSPVSLQMPWGLETRTRWPGIEAGCLLALSSPGSWMFHSASAALLAGFIADAGTKAAYAGWMTGAVLSCGLLAAWIGSHPRWRQGCSHLLPWLEHAAGLVLGTISIAFLAGALGTAMIWASLTGQAGLPESLPAARQVQPPSTAQHTRRIPCAWPHCRARRAARRDLDL
jgi:threonine/homoserine/homoserine lactone efflux protein